MSVILFAWFYSISIAWFLVFYVTWFLSTVDWLHMGQISWWGPPAEAWVCPEVAYQLCKDLLKAGLAEDWRRDAQSGRGLLDGQRDTTAQLDSVKGDSGRRCLLSTAGQRCTSAGICE